MEPVGNGETVCGYEGSQAKKVGNDSSRELQAFSSVSSVLDFNLNGPAKKNEPHPKHFNIVIYIFPFYSQTIVETSE